MDLLNQKGKVKISFCLKRVIPKGSPLNWYPLICVRLFQNLIPFIYHCAIKHTNLS